MPFTPQGFEVDSDTALPVASITYWRKLFILIDITGDTVYVCVWNGSAYEWKEVINVGVGNAKRWADEQKVISVTNVAGDKAGNDIVVSGIPTGATIISANLMFKFQWVSETSGAPNKLDGAQEIQVKKNVGGSWTDGINLFDDFFELEGNAVRGGNIIIGSIDVKAEVTGNGTYNVQWDEALADADGLDFEIVSFGLTIDYTV